MPGTPRDLATPALWQASMQRSLARREGRPIPGAIERHSPHGGQVGNAGRDLASDHEQALARDLARDLADGDPWQLSLGRSRARRRAAKLQFVPARTRARRISLGALIAFAAAPVAWIGETGGVAQASTVTSVGAVNTADTPSGETQPASDPVKVLQAALHVGVDGVFGPRTLAAVKRFQVEHHLPVDGVVGPKMWDALGYSAMKDVSEAPAWVAATAHKQRPAATTTSTASHVSSVQRPVRLLQRLLHVVVDGEFGPETLAAVERLQGAHGLEANGIVGPRTWAALGYRGVREISPLPWARPSKASSPARPHSSDGDAETNAGGSESPGAASSPVVPAARETDSAGGAAPAPAPSGSTFALCVANHEAGESGSTSPGTVNWTIKDSPYEGGFQWLNSTWIAQGGGRYAPRAAEATPTEQIAIFEAAVRTDAGAWPQSVPACGG